MAHTERAAYNFTVKYTTGGEPFIELEPRGRTFSVLAPTMSRFFDRLWKGPTYSFMSLDLAQGTCGEEAERLASLLDSKVISVAITHF